MALWFPDRVYRATKEQDTCSNFNSQGHNAKRHHFAQAGIEKESGATGFAYGSHDTYDKRFMRNDSLKGHKLDNKTSAERVKLKKQQQEVEENHQAYLAQRTVEKQNKLEEQRKDLEQLQQYYPWGKPAGGAPRYTPSGAPQARIRRHLPQVDKKTGYNPYGRPGAGAPLRTISGKLTTQIKGARDIRFQEHLKREVDSLKNYDDDERAKTIGKALQSTLDRTESEKLRITEERKKKLAYGKRLEEQHLEGIARRERDKRELLDGPTGYIWGRNKGISRDDSGKLLPRKIVINNDNYTSTESGVSSIASQMMTSAHRVATNKPNTSTINDEGIDKFDPWGKPGAGAPLRDGRGQVRACGVYGKHSRDMEKKSAHLTVTVDKTATARGDGFDMATWMRAKHEDPKLNKNQLLEESNGNYYTDLQAQAEQRHRQQQQLKDKSGPVLWSKGGRTKPLNEQDLTRSKEYSDDLRRAVEERSLQKKQSRENNIAMEKQHALTFAQHWGRPGAGAPRTNSQGRVEAMHKNTAALQSQVHTNQHFRN